MADTHNRNINDPVYGFIRIDDPLISRVLSHPYMQRLRRITQVGLTSLVYPGAVHNRFLHSVGAMHLMSRAIATLREKGFDISDDEATAAKIAILLHDVGHAPFSHTLEGALLDGISHEDISLAVMESLRREHPSPVMDRAIRIFRGDYPKRYLHSLISSQLDMDRLDYLSRDSFFTGASEGIVSHERIIAMMDVADGDIVFDEKGLYSVEKFVIARRMMYWQVYLHKTVLAADVLVEGIVRRAKELLARGADLPVHEPLRSLLMRKPTGREGLDEQFLERYMAIDESDMWCVFKQWRTYDDFILSFLCRAVCERRLFFARLSDAPPSLGQAEEIERSIRQVYGADADLLPYLFTVRRIDNHVYRPKEDNIRIKLRDGRVRNITEVSQQVNFTSDRTETKYLIVYPKSCISR